MGVYILDPLAWDFLTPGEALDDAGPAGVDAGGRARGPLLPPALLLARHRPARRLRHGQRDLRGPPGGVPGRARASRSSRSGATSELSLTSASWIQSPGGPRRLPDRGDPVRLPGLLRGPGGSTSARSGSGNIGATNVGRILGFRYFLLVFALDVLKGFAADASACRWLCGAWASTPPADLPRLRRAGGDPGPQLPGLSRLQGGQGRGDQPGRPPGPRAARLRGRGGRLLRSSSSSTRYVSLSSIAGGLAFVAGHFAIVRPSPGAGRTSP